MSEDTRPAPYSIRFEPEMRERLEQAAKLAGRSLHAEIIMRLENSLNETSEKVVLSREEFKALAREVFQEELAKQGKR